jgi:hypothetical protein
MPKSITNRRCPNGTRRNKKTGNCDPVNKSATKTLKAKKFERCPNGTRRNKYTGDCEPTNNTSTPVMMKERKPPFPVDENQRARKIQQFMLQNKQKIRALFLNTICSDSGSCIALGTNSDKIKQFFGGFIDFTYLSSVRKIGKSSANGAICELTYEHRGYNSHAIVKMNAKPGSDSLFYEYFVGIRINHYCKHFPCFLETYGSYTVDPVYWKEMKEGTHPVTKHKLFANFALNSPDAYDISKSCENDYYKTYAIMIQHLKVKSGEETMGDCIQMYNFRQTNLISSLYQVYFALSALAEYELYTHYDLHENNVMMYVPDPNGYIEYHYHHTTSGGMTTRFKSKYIVKIIDYGRNFIKVDGMPENSTLFSNKLCKDTKCSQPRTPCGEKYGYAFFNTAVNNHYIVPSKSNISHDLRLCKRIIDEIHDKLYIEDFDAHTLLSSVVYQGKYGTPEVKKYGFPDHIHNVMDAEMCMRDYLDDHRNKTSNDLAYLGKKKIGDLHVYANLSKKMHFVAA